MTAELLSSIAGIVLSLLFSYVPQVKNWYDPQPPTTKRLVMLALLLAVAGGSYAGSCAGCWSGVTCDQAGALGLVRVFVAALIANQSTYLISPKNA